MTRSDFFSGLAASWDEAHARPQEQEKLRRFAVHFRLRPGERVLDAGCGSGRLIPLVLQAVGAGGSLVELDFAPGMVDLARGKAEDERVQFIVGDVHQLPFPDGRFDRVIALALLPHLDDPGMALREFHRVLRPDGMLVIAHQLGREALDRLHGESSEPVRRDRLPRKKELARLLRKANFAAHEIADEAERYMAWARA
jgi:demethylmenaquinone methyltransferase/2-methoxy-6-polyprenyl-1,4-benzoquinol methylase